MLLGGRLGCTRASQESPKVDAGRAVSTSAGEDGGAQGAASHIGAEGEAAPSDSMSTQGVLPPLAGFFEGLPVPGHADAWISLPTGATSRRPVLVVIHGAGDRPDWQCGGWRRAMREFPFIVCPRGRVAPGEGTSADDVRYTHANGPGLLAHIDAALAALTARYPAYVDTRAPLLAGFSLGSYGVFAIAASAPERFPRVALVEGLTDVDDVRARRFREGGGQRILFGCGQPSCRGAASAAAKRLATRDGVEAHVAYAAVHHTFDPPLEDAVGVEVPWFVDGDERWATRP